MTEAELDALLAQTLPERDGGEFSVMLMERIAHAQARPARILAWITVAILGAMVAAAGVFGASAAGHRVFGVQSLALPCTLAFLTLLLSFVVLQSARD
jgi:Mn2+/Fe2+ NRAMP family transporter